VYTFQNRLEQLGFSCCSCGGCEEEEEEGRASLFALTSSPWLEVPFSTLVNDDQKDDIFGCLVLVSSLPASSSSVIELSFGFIVRVEVGGVIMTLLSLMSVKTQ
jgi:hypothetical protein